MGLGSTATVIAAISFRMTKNLIDAIGQRLNISFLHHNTRFLINGLGTASSPIRDYRRSTCQRLKIHRGEIVCICGIDKNRLLIYKTMYSVFTNEKDAIYCL